MLALTHETTKLPPDRNQSIDFQSKSIDWFLYNGVNGLNELTHVTSRNYRQFINALNLENYDKHFQHLRTVKNFWKLFLCYSIFAPDSHQLLLQDEHSRLSKFFEALQIIIGNTITQIFWLQ